MFDHCGKRKRKATSRYGDSCDTGANRMTLIEKLSDKKE